MVAYGVAGGSSESSDYDLFISYAHLDNEEDWVTNAHRLLENTIKRRLGARKLSVFRDAGAGSNRRVEELIEIAARSKVFLALGSPSFITSDYCLAELRAFLRASQDSGRVFVAELLPLQDESDWPVEIRSHIRRVFYGYETGDPTPHPFSDYLYREQYTKKMHALASDIANKLAEIDRKAAATSPTARPMIARSEPLPEGFERKTVLLAQTTEALEDEADQIRAYLGQFGVTVLPEQSYPQGGTDFKTAFLLDLDRADLVVQLLDRRPGRRPPDLPEGYTAFQAAAAESKSVELMQWRHPEIDVTSADEAYQAMLHGEAVVASGLSEFKEALKRRAIVPVSVNRPRNGAVVYIHADESDFVWAKRIAEKADRFTLFCKWPRGAQTTASEQAVRDDLGSSQAVLLLYCDASPDWVRAQGEWIYTKYYSRDQMWAVCSGPPDGKPPLNFRFPGARVIDSRDETDFLRQIDEFLSEIAA